MPFLLADEIELNKNCDEFRRILGNYTVIKTVGEEGKQVRMIREDAMSDLVVDLCNAIFGKHFRELRHPVPTVGFLSLGTSGTMANFNPENWVVSLNDALLTCVGPQPIKFAPVIFSSIYHEYRHAEQFSLIIRYAWAQHPSWLKYENLVYERSRNEHRGKPGSPTQVSDRMVMEAYEAWKREMFQMSDGAVRSFISRSLTTIGGASVSIRAVKALALYPLSTLEDVPQATINQAALWFQSRFRTWAEEFGGRRSLMEDGRMFDLDETGAANTASSEASVFGDARDVELKEWNKAMPTSFPNWPVSTRTALGKTFTRLRSSRGAFDDEAKKTIHDYLRERRAVAVEMITATQGWYEGVPLEKDTHDLEKKVREILKFSNNTVDSVAKSSGVLKTKYLPAPTDWTA